MTTARSLFTFHVGVKGRPEWGRDVVAETPGRAKAKYLRGLQDAWPDATYMDLTVRKMGAPQTTDEFRRNAEYRGIAFAKVGMRVRVGAEWGTIVGHNSSANLNVLFDRSGLTLNCHPNWEIIYYDEAGSVIKSYAGSHSSRPSAASTTEGRR